MKKYLFPILGILISLSSYAQNVGINTTPASPPTNTLDVNGTLRVRGGTPGAGKVLTSDANGVGSWTTSSANYPRISYDAILALPSPTKGDIAYDITFDCLRVYTGSNWICTYQNPANYTPNVTAIASAGGASDDIVNSIAVDDLGNVYVTGYYQGTITFGGITKTSAGSADIFVAKYNNTGTLQWVQSAGGTSDDIGYGIAIDGLGSVYVTGYFTGTASFGGMAKTSAGSNDVFVVKYNSSGTLQWLQSAGGTNYDISNSIAVDGSGNIYVTGTYKGTTTFGAITKTSAGDSDIFLAKYSSSGTLQWLQSVGGINGDVGNSIAVDGSGNVYVTGYYTGTASFGAIARTSAGSTDIFVAKYDPLGVSWTWVQSSGGTSSDVGNSVTVDVSGNIYVTGYYQGTASFGASSKNSEGLFEMFVAKYNSGGTTQWVQSAGGTGFDAGSSISVDGSGNVYATGYYNNVATFGTNLITSEGGSDIFIAKYNNSGILKWVQSAGGIMGDSGKSIALDGSGNLYIAGAFTGTATFGATAKTSAGGNDIFVLRLDK